MHIPDGFLSPLTCVACYGLAVPAWLLASRRVKSAEDTRAISLIGLAAAFSFGLMMFNVPIPGGTTGHAAGTCLISVMMGPSAAILAVSATLLVQALMFGDGGITTFAANCLGIAIVPSLVAFSIWRLSSLCGATRTCLAVRSFVAGFFPILAGAVVMALLLGLQPIVAQSSSGHPEYFPFGILPTLSAVGIAHIFIGFIEGVVTAAAVSAMSKMPEWKSQIPTPDLGWFQKSAAWVSVAVMLLVMAAGILLPLWTGAADPWGEWSPSETAQHAGLTSVPDGMSKVTGMWKAPLREYAFSGSPTTVRATTEYVGAGLLGMLIVGLFFWGVQKMLTRRSGLED